MCPLAQRLLLPGLALQSHGEPPQLALDRALGSGTSSLFGRPLHVRAFWKHRKGVTHRKAGEMAL
jgi:hypothetical protein